MAKAMGKSFFPYVEKSLSCIVKLFSFKNSTDLRESVIKTL